MGSSRSLPEECFVPGRKVNSKDLWTGTPMFEVGDKVTFNPPFYWHMKPGKGTVIYIFKAGYTPHPDLVKMYYQIDENDRRFKDLCKPCEVHRFVIQRQGESNFEIFLESVVHTLAIRHEGVPYKGEED